MGPAPGPCRKQFSQRYFLSALFSALFFLLAIAARRMSLLALSYLPVLTYTFLPYGSGSAKPSSASLQADFAVEASGTTIPGTVVAGSDQVYAVRGDATGITGAMPIDAGPFDTVEEAAALMLRWLLEYWECAQLPSGESNSCFEWGGCHRRCWWRGSAGRVVFKLQRRSGASEEESPSLSLLYERAAADGTPAEASKAETTLPLLGTLVSLGDGRHYCGLRPCAL